MPRNYFPHRGVRISRALIISMTLVVVAAVVISGLAAAITSRLELQRQVWLRVEEAQAATLALYDSERERIETFSDLIAQRPTLCDLVESRNREALESYLLDLHESMGLDALVVSASNNETYGIGLGELPPLDTFFNEHDLPFADFVVLENPLRVCVIAAREIHTADECDVTPKGWLIIGRGLDNSFMRILSHQTGLAQSLFVGETRVASSLIAVPEWPFAPDAAESVARGEGACCARGASDDQNYFLGLAPIVDRKGQVLAVSEVALPSKSIDVGVQRTLGLIFLVGLGMVLGGSILVSALTRRITNPLTQITETARRVAAGDLEASFTGRTNFVEISQLISHLDQARNNISHAQLLAQQERDRAEQLLEAIRDGVIALDEAGLVTFFNAEAERLLGLSSGDVQGVHHTQVFRVTADETVTLEDVLSPPVGSPPIRRLTVLDPRDHPITLEIAVSHSNIPGAAGQARERVLVIHDVSEEEAANRLRSNFLANVSHELRTPLSSVVAIAELLIEEGPELKDKELADLAATIRMSTMQLQTLVDNLLESATIDAGLFRVQLQRTHIEDIIISAVQTMAPLLRRRDQDLKTEILENIPSINADPDRLVQVLVNLLANASKFGPMGEQIILTVTKLEEELEVAVLDSGPGLPAGRFADLFKRFATSNISPRLRYGPGLGLSVVKAIVQAHNGRVGAENRPEGGARVWFTIPLI